MFARYVHVRGIFVLVALTLACPAFALVPGLETAPADANLPYQSFDWTYVGEAGQGSCVAVDDYWLLSVQHYTAPTTVELGDGNTYTVEEIVGAPTDPNTGMKPDLRLIRVNEKLPGYYDLYPGAPSSAVGEVALIAGTGFDGTTLNSGTRYTYDPNTGRTLRWGTNRLDSTEYKEEVGLYSQVYVMEFSSSDTFNEVGLGDHDSGAGVFVNISSDPNNPNWVLAGLGAYIYPSGAGYDTNRAIALNDDYRQWIADTVPEPTTLALLGLGAAGLMRRRRK